MTVKVRLLGEFRKHLRGRPEPLVCEVPAAASVADLADILGLDPGLEMVVGVNGLLARADSSLADGDEVVFVSPMSGG